MMQAIFIDGPLAQEVMTIVGLPDIYKIPLPRRETTCWCSSDIPDVHESTAEIFIYYRVMKGDGIALYSKSNDPGHVLRSLKEWVVTDLSNVDKLVYSCRDRRAFS